MFLIVTRKKKIANFFLFVLKLLCTMNIIYLDRVNSTNSYAKENIQKFEDKTIISANTQSGGRGRFNRVWIDMGEGNLFMSIVLKPSSVFNPVYANLTQYMSVVLCRIFEEYGLEPQIKWPNDVLIEGKKIAGILCETVIQNGSLKGLILGVGVNLNADKDKLSLVSDKPVTALNLELSREYEDKHLFTEKLLNEFFKHYDSFLMNGFIMIKDEYLQRCSFIGKKIKVQLYDKTIEAVAMRLTDSGELILKDGKKEIALSSGDII